MMNISISFTMRNEEINARKIITVKYATCAIVACEQQTHFRSSLLSLRKIERNDDRKYVCCSQASAIAKKKPEQIQACRDFNPDLYDTGAAL